VREGKPIYRIYRNALLLKILTSVPAPLSLVPLYFSSLSLLRTALHYLNAWNRLRQLRYARRFTDLPISVSRPLAFKTTTLPRTGMFVWSRYVCTCYHTFFHIPLPLLHNYDVKIMNNFTFYGGRKQATTKLSFSF